MTPATSQTWEWLHNAPVGGKLPVYAVSWRRERLTTAEWIWRRTITSRWPPIRGLSRQPSRRYEPGCRRHRITTGVRIHRPTPGA